MRNKFYLLASLMIVAAMVLGACAPAATPAAPAQPQEPQVVVTEIVKTVEVQVPGESKVEVVTATPPPAAPPKEFKSKDPTTFVYAVFGDPETLDPAYDYESAGSEIIQNVYDSLVTTKKSNPAEFVAQLATEVPSLDNGGISADGKTYTFKVRQGVKFHDGSAMTPSDVAYTFQRGLLQGGTSSPQILLSEPILGVGVLDVTDLANPDELKKIGVETVNDDPANLIKLPPEELERICKVVTDAIVADDAAGTVTFKLPQAWGPFISTVAGAWGSVQSKAWVSKNSGWDGDCKTWQNFYGKNSDDLNKTALGTSAMGTGPYMLDHWTPGEEIVLKAN